MGVRRGHRGVSEGVRRSHGASKRFIEVPGGLWGASGDVRDVSDVFRSGGLKCFQKRFSEPPGGFQGISGALHWQ